MQALRTDNFKGHLLVAAPYLKDPFFEKAVIFVFSHDTLGAMGIVINRTIERLTTSCLLDQLGIQSGATVGGPVYSGGPIESARGFVLHTSDYQHESTVHIMDCFSVTSTVDILTDISHGGGASTTYFSARLCNVGAWPTG